VGRLDELASVLQSFAVKELRERNEMLASRRLASLETYHRNRLAKLDTDIQDATNERILRMKRSERERAQRDYERKLADIEGHRDADIISRRIAAGILEVRSAD
jgi:ATP-dependent helicase HepA